MLAFLSPLAPCVCAGCACLASPLLPRSALRFLRASSAPAVRPLARAALVFLALRPVPASVAVAAALVPAVLALFSLCRARACALVFFFLPLVPVLSLPSRVPRPAVALMSPRVRCVFVSIFFFSPAPVALLLLFCVCVLVVVGPPSPLCLRRSSLSGPAPLFARLMKKFSKWLFETFKISFPNL